MAKKPTSFHYRVYNEVYFFGGFSSQKNVLSTSATANGNSYPVDIIYKNTGLGGLGMATLFIGKDKNPDLMVDFETSFYGAKMNAIVDNPPVNVELAGFAMCLDMHFSVFPIKARNSYPSPFVFAGAGMRIVKLSYETASASEFHGELPFGIGFRQKISNSVAFQVRERFVYSKLKDVSGFILPETRFELIISTGRR
ncbi:MAG: hypothetical protein WCO44_12915 [Bacteroidota bacterium]